MTTIHLSTRLQTIADFIDNDERVADIGTDHAFLPIALAQSQKVSYALASDVGAGPVAIAKANIAAAGLTDTIDVRQADGLVGIRPEDGISTVVIAGMGGELISRILEDGIEHLDGTETLVLSPHRDTDQVRRWLSDHEFGIVDEAIVEDEGHVYEIIVAGRTMPDVPYTDADIEFGPLLRKQRSALFISELERRERALTRVREGLAVAEGPVAEKIATVEAELALVQEELQ